MEKMEYANVCRICLTDNMEFGEPLTNWVDDVLLMFGLEVFLDDGLPQQICFDCSHTLMITSKLRETAYKADVLLKTDHKIDVKPHLGSDELFLPDVSFDESANLKSNKNNTKHSHNNTNETDESLTVNLNFPVIKNEMRVILEKLPDHISNTYLVYCSICLLAFTDSDRYKIHLYFNIHNTKICNSCNIKYENGAQFWKHINSAHVDQILKKVKNDEKGITNDKDKEKTEASDELIISIKNQPKHRTKMSEESRKKEAEYRRKYRANMTEEQRKKRVEQNRIGRAKMTEEQRKKRTEYKRKYCANMTEEQRKKLLETNKKWRVNMTEEQRNKQKENDRIWRANMSEEQRKKERENSRKRKSNMTEEQRMKERENARKRNSNMTEEQRKKLLETKKKWRANMTEEQRMKRREYYRKRRANMTEEQRKKKMEYDRKRIANMSEELRRKHIESSRKWRAKEKS